MLQVRSSIFETNSSSVHSLCMCHQSDYDRFRAGELVFYNYNDCLVDASEAVDEIRECRMSREPDHVDDPIDDSVMEEHGYYTYARFWRHFDDDFETFCDDFDDVVAFGYYGHD